MSQGIRILHLADSHIGAQLAKRPRMRKRSRGDDFLDAYAAVLRSAFASGIDLVLHAGDVFDAPDPPPHAIAAAAAPLLEFASADIPVVVVPGNHERSLLPGSLLFSHPNIHVLDRPLTRVFSLRGLRVAVSGFPCIRRRSAAEFPVAVEATQFAAAPADMRILLVHQAFESAVCGPANYKFRSGEDVVERGAIPAQFDYVAAGHIHRHQALQAAQATLFAKDRAAAPSIVYCGSVDRISFAEKDEPKGAVYVEFDGAHLSHRFVEHAVRPMALLPLDISGWDRERIRCESLSWLERLPESAVAQVRLSGQTTPGEMRGLALAALAAERRPDVLLTVAAQSIEFVSNRARHSANAAPFADQPESAGSPHALTNTPARSFFDCLGSGRGETIALHAADRKRLPRTFGTYLLFDADDRLLYVGKANNLRARVAQHINVRRGAAAAFFSGWTERIDRVEARVAYSEIEALIVEAELVRRLRPPFNQQMRAWRRYTYLSEGVLPFGQLRILNDLAPEACESGESCGDPGAPLAASSFPQNALSKVRIFGPYSSRSVATAIADAAAHVFGVALCPVESKTATNPRLNSLPGSAASRLCQRYFSGICTGPCAERVAPSQYAEQLDARARLLRGESDAPLVPLEAALSERVESGADLTAAEVAAVQRVGSLRFAFERGRLLGGAAQLLDSTLRLPGPSAFSTFVHASVAGISIRVGACDDGRHRSSCVDRSLQDVPRVIPKSLSDCLCAIARHLAREDRAARGEADSQDHRSPLNQTASAPARADFQPSNV